MGSDVEFVRIIPISRELHILRKERKVLQQSHLTLHSDILSRKLAHYIEDKVRILNTSDADKRHGSIS